MPKHEPETIDRFRIYAETSAESMGPLLAQLTRMGLENIGYELITDVVRFNKKSAGGGEQLAREWIGQRQSFKLAELAAYFAEHGRGQSSAAGFCARFVEEGFLTALGNGYYSNVKAIAAPVEVLEATEQPKKQHRSTGITRPHFEKRGSDVIWQHIKNRLKKPFTVPELKALFRAQGRNETSVSPIISKMFQDKLIKRVGDGEYVAIEGKEPKKQTRQTPHPGIERNTQNRHEVSNRALILDHIKGRKSFTSTEISELFKKVGRPVNSATGQLSAMVKNGVFEKGGVGEYIVANNNINGTGTETAHG